MSVKRRSPATPSDAALPSSGQRAHGDGSEGALTPSPEVTAGVASAAAPAPRQLTAVQPEQPPVPPETVVQVDGRRVASQSFGSGTSRYYPPYLTQVQEQSLLQWCKEEVRFQIYQCTTQQLIKGGLPRLKAPKAEFYLLDEQDRRPHYKWIQLNDFNHAGQPMPPILQELCVQLNTDFSLSGDDRLNHCLIICNENDPDKHEGVDAHCAPPHADKIQKGFFVDISLGYAREMQLLDAQVQDNPMVASQALASGSLAYITADDNGRLVQGSQKQAGQSKVQGTRYYHAVPVDRKQPRHQPRFSLVFRPITDHPKGAKCGEHLARVDETKAARVRPGGDLWREYVPLCRGGDGAAPIDAGRKRTAPDQGGSSVKRRSGVSSPGAAEEGEEEDEEGEEEEGDEEESDEEESDDEDVLVFASDESDEEGEGVDHAEMEAELEAEMSAQQAAAETAAGEVPQAGVRVLLATSCRSSVAEERARLRASHRELRQQKRQQRADSQRLAEVQRQADHGQAPAQPTPSDGGSAASSSPSGRDDASPDQQKQRKKITLFVCTHIDCGWHGPARKGKDTTNCHETRKPDCPYQPCGVPCCNDDKKAAVAAAYLASCTPAQRANAMPPVGGRARPIETPEGYSDAVQWMAVMIPEGAQLGDKFEQLNCTGKLAWQFTVPAGRKGGDVIVAVSNKKPRTPAQQKAREETLEKRREAAVAEAAGAEQAAAAVAAPAEGRRAAAAAESVEIARLAASIEQRGDAAGQGAFEIFGARTRALHATEALPSPQPLPI